MGEVIPFPSRNVAEAAVGTVAGRRPPATVFHDRGWRILELPSSGQYLAVSGYCRRGVVVGGFAPQAGQSFEIITAATVVIGAGTPVPTGAITIDVTGALSAQP